MKVPFKEKVAREVDDMVHDEERAGQFLSEVKSV